MTLNELKMAAKRLRKQGAELFGTSASNLTHAQALDVAARLHGFRDYHEAQQRLGQRQLLDQLLAEPGGLLSTEGVAFDMSKVVLAASGTVHVVGVSGSGKSMLCNELVVQALAQGRPVRLIDCGGSYRRLTQMLGGQHFSGIPTEQALAAWASDAALVTLDAWESSNAHLFDFERLQQLPPRSLALCDEAWLFSSTYRPLPALTTVLVGQQDDDLPSPAQHRLTYSRANGSELFWQWQGGGRPVELRLHVGPRRLATYSTRLEHIRALGAGYDEARMDAFIQTLQPGLKR